MIFSAFAAGTCDGLPAARCQKLLVKKQLLRCMRVSMYFLLFFGCSIQLLIARDASGQDINKTGIRLELSNESLITAFKKIEKLSSFTFAYNKKEISPVRNLNLGSADRSLRQTLDLLLQNTSLHYEQIGNNIVVTLPPVARKPEPSGKRAGVEDSTISIHGIVSNKDGKGVAGASILVKGSAQGTSTDDKGFFYLKNVSANATLKISSGGF